MRNMWTGELALFSYAENLITIVLELEMQFKSFLLMHVVLMQTSCSFYGFLEVTDSWSSTAFTPLAGNQRIQYKMAMLTCKVLN